MNHMENSALATSAVSTDSSALAAKSQLVFNPRHVSFGRAQTFPLRLGWLPKLRVFLTEHAEHAQDHASPKSPKSKIAPNTPISRFSDDDMMAELGVGKNMITAIKHWARAADVINNDMTLTDFGERIFAADGFDPYLEDEATLWLLHWKIASRPCFFTAGYFLFNRCFNSDDFTAEHILDDVVEQIQSTGVNCRRGSVKGDIHAALHMYAMRPSKRGDGDESLESPFPLLGLIRAAAAPSHYTFAMEPRESLPAAVVGYAATELFAVHGNVLHLFGEGGTKFSRHSTTETASLAGVFRITEDSLLQKLETFCRIFPVFILRETAGGWQLFLNGKPPSSFQLLKAVYAAPVRDGAKRAKLQSAIKKSATLDAAAGGIHAA